MRKSSARLLLTAFAVIGLGLSACSPDAVPPTAPFADNPSLTVSPTPAWVVTKTINPSWERRVTYDWTVEKTVAPGDLVLGKGESGTHHFTISATRTEVGSAASYRATGEICVTNNTAKASVDLKVLDRIYVEKSPGNWVEVVAFWLDVSSNPVLDSGESHCYPYERAMDPAFTPNPALTYKNRGYVYVTQTPGGVPTEVRVADTTVEFDWPIDQVLSEEDATATLADLLVCPTGFSCTPASAGWTFGGSDSRELSVLVTNIDAECDSEFIVRNKVTLTESDSGVEHEATASAPVASPSCAPPLSIHGCTPGYWKQPHHFDSWVGHTQNEDFDAVFGVSLFRPDRTLLQALSTGGGKANRLGRHSVAALLNTTNSSVEYGMTPSQVIDLVQDAVTSGNYDEASDRLEALNERGCPLS